MGKAIFIAGTDTGVGKTYIALKLAKEYLSRGIKAGVMKPISTGPAKKNDARLYKKFLNLDDPLRRINPVHLKLPLAPYAAAKLENKKININKIFSAFKKLKEKYEVLLVEGIGGVLVPLAHDYLVIDLIKDLNIPVVVVARSGLGTINHTLLTLEALRRKKIKILGIIMNGFRGEPSEKTNPEVIKRFGKVPILRKIKWEN